MSRQKEPSCSHLSTIRDVRPSSADCEECVRLADTWVHLRMCLECGRVGCCDSSKNRHARAHAQHERHPIIASREPGEDWKYCFVDDVMWQ